VGRAVKEETGGGGGPRGKLDESAFYESRQQSKHSKQCAAEYRKSGDGSQGALAEGGGVHGKEREESHHLVMK